MTSLVDYMRELRRLEPYEVIETLEITSKDLVERFADRIEQQYNGEDLEDSDSDYDFLDEYDDFEDEYSDDEEEDDY